MSMTVNAVIIYLAIVLAGFAAVPIADSFAVNKIATLSACVKQRASLQDFILRRGRKLPLFRGRCTFSYFSNWKQCRDSVKRTGSILAQFSLSCDHLPRKNYYSPAYRLLTPFSFHLEPQVFTRRSESYSMDTTFRDVLMIMGSH